MESPGREGLMIAVEYPPALQIQSTDTTRTHLFMCWKAPCHASEGRKQVTVTAGPTFYEGPDDIHVVGRNASNTKPAKFLVFLVKDKGAPVVMPSKVFVARKSGAAPSLELQTSDSPKGPAWLRPFGLIRTDAETARRHCDQTSTTDLKEDRTLDNALPVSTRQTALLAGVENESRTAALLLSCYQYR